MRKRILMAFAALCVLAAICAAGYSKNEDATEQADRALSEESPDDEDTGEASGDEEALMESEGDTAGEISEEADGAASESAYSETLTDREYFAAAFERGDVKHNGANFVGVGDRVYYMQYEPSSFEESALFGEFLGALTENRAGTLCYYDAKKGESGSAGNLVFGGGKLFAARGGIYLSGSEDGSDVLYLVYPDGSGYLTIGEGKPVGISEDGEYLAAEGYTEDFNERLLLYHGEEVIATREAGSDEYLRFCAVAGGRLVYLVCDQEDNELSLCSMGADGEELLIGEAELPSGVYAAEGEVAQAIFDGQAVYVNVVFYQGTGHFAAGQSAFRAVPDENGSLTAIEAEPVDGDGYAKLYLTSDGELKTAERIPGDIELSKGSYGDLLYYDESGEAVTLSEGFFSDPESDEAKEGLGTSMLQDYAVIGDEAFLFVADCERDEENDIGWREAYRLLNLKTLCVPLDKSTGVVILADVMKE